MQDKDSARAFYGVVHETVLEHAGDSPEIKQKSAGIALAIDEIVQRNIVVDFHLKTDAQNKILNEIEDYLADKTDLELSYEQIDLIMEKIINIAKRRYTR